MALTFDCVLVAAGREPSGFAVLIRHSPDGLRRSANKVSAIWLASACGSTLKSNLDKALAALTTILAQ